MATESVNSEITGKVWKLVCAVGDTVEEEGPILIIESMKMEIPVLAEAGGTVAEIKVTEGDVVQEGDVLVVLA